MTPGPTPISTGADAGDEPVARLSIGEVLVRLRHEFADVSISKIRFLEAEGLVEPQRTPSGYRKFSEADVERLRYVLTTQREHYLPLKVIKEHLAAIDRGLEPPAIVSGRPAPPVRAAGDEPAAATFTGPGAGLRLTRDELLEAAGTTAELLDQLETYGLVSKRGTHYDDDALTVARTAGQLAEYGVEPRHLRPFRTAADREVGLIEQVISPLSRQRDPDAASAVDEVLGELAALSVRLHAALVRAGLRDHRSTG